MREIKDIRVVIVGLDREATPRDYAIVWNAAQGLLRGLSGVIGDHNDMIGTPATLTAVLTQVARMLAEFEPGMRAKLIELVEKEIARAEQKATEDTEEAKDSLDAMEQQAVDLSKLVPQGNA